MACIGEVKVGINSVLAPHEEALADYFCGIGAPPGLIVWMIKRLRLVARVLALLKGSGLSKKQLDDAAKEVWKGGNPHVVASKLIGSKGSVSSANAPPAASKKSKH